ncbi:MAG: hypothetical protein K6T90_08785 [Leptolyngbyaceae cyanobacterium HOT.MB2.61]|jgi:hypothetical protein|nr:hypothetical protein [Leptolyngbyaceae cyanobacterium HOT.MB2.61]
MSTSKKRVALVAIATAISVLAASCGESKVTQCNKISNVVNKAAKDAQAASKSNNPDKVGELERAANSLDQYAGELEAVKVKDETLQGLQTRFIKMYRETGKAGKELVEAARKKDNRAITSSLKTLNEATQQESSLVNEFNQYCRGS